MTVQEAAERLRALDQELGFEFRRHRSEVDAILVARDDAERIYVSLGGE